MGVLITPMALAHLLHPIKSRSTKNRQNLWVGWCASSWRPWFWPVYFIYYIHITHNSCILSNQNKLVLRDIHIKSCCGHVGVLDYLILLLFPVWFQVYIQLYSPVFSISEYGYRYHVALYIGSQHPITVYRTGFGVCVVLVLSVIRCFCYYSFDRILFHNDFHHNSCDYHWDFCGHCLLFWTTLFRLSLLK